jgi:putative ABC transport system permease protein
MNGLLFSARQLLRAPVFLTLATLALALGIGSTTTIFSIVRAVFLRALPYSEPETLMQLTSSVPEQQIDGAGFSWPRYEAVRARQTAFSAMSYAAPTAFTVTGAAEPEQILGQQAAFDYLPLLGLQPVLGRGFTADEDRPGGPDVALLSHGLWERRFGARPDVLGQAIILDGRPHTIVGVMPRHANRFPMAQVAIWTPRPQEVSYLVRRQIDDGGFFFTVLARLKPGTSLEAARAQVRDIALAYAAAHPTNADTKATADVNPLLDDLVGDQRQTYLILFAAVACLLLIASANVANLALARYAARRRQIAIRCAIGAGRRHVIAEMLSENLVLALAGGALGVLLAAAALELVKAWAADQIPRAEEIALDPLVLLFSLAVSLLTGLALSLFPVWQLSKPDIIDALKDGGREVAAGRHHSRMRSTLLVAEVAVSFVLLVAAGLLVASFARLQAVDPKFSAERILVGNIQAPQTRYPDGSEALVQLYSRLLERVREIPGVTAAAINDSPPLTGSGPAPFAVVGESVPPIGQQPVALRHIVSPGAFELLGVRVVRGRDFSASDVLGKPPLIIINETMAKQAFPTGDPIGREVLTGMLQRKAQIIGVVADTQSVDLATPPVAEMYHPVFQRPENFTSILVKAVGGDPLLLLGALRAAVAEVDPSIPITNPNRYETLVEQNTAVQRMITSLLSTFAMVALLLAVLGVYSVMTYSVGQRMGEIGVRMALGARPSQVQGMVVKQGLVLTAVGMGIGVVGALLVTQAMRELLFETPAADPVIYLGIAAVFSVIAVLATWIPARRAAQVDPLIVLRG